jgi:hypothetical protein
MHHPQARLGRQVGLFERDVVVTLIGDGVPAL